MENNCRALSWMIRNQKLMSVLAPQQPNSASPSGPYRTIQEPCGAAQIVVESNPPLQSHFSGLFTLLIKLLQRQKGNHRYYWQSKTGKFFMGLF